MEPSQPAPSRSRARALSTTLGKHVGGVPAAAAAASAPAPALRWRGAAVLACAAAYTLLFAFRWQATSPLFLGLFPALYLALPLKALPALLLSSLARLPSAAPAGAALAESAVGQYKLCVARGLLASAAGDVLLDLCELPGLEDAAFLAGLACFLAAHVLYAQGFYATAQRPLSALLGVACALPSALVASYLARHIQASPVHAPLLGPVCVYTCVITLMWYLSLARDEGGGLRAYYLTAAGATLFLASDVALAFGKFAPPPLHPDSGEVRWWFSSPKVVVMVTYYAAQSLLACGAWGTAEARPKAKRL